MLGISITFALYYEYAIRLDLYLFRVLLIVYVLNFQI